MGPSPVVPQFIGSTVAGTNAHITFTDGDATHQTIVGISSADNQPLTGQPVGWAYVIAPTGKGIFIWSGTSLVAAFGPTNSSLNSHWYPDADATWDLGIASRYWRALFLNGTFNWASPPTSNPGPGKVWSNLGILTMGT